MTTLPLAGKRVLVTRSREQAGRLSDKLTAQGASVIEIPAIEILPPMSYEPLDAGLRRLSAYQWLVVTSANTVRSIQERMAALGLSPDDFVHLRIAAVGSATRQTLEEMGLQVSVTPPEYVAESLVEALGERCQGARVLIARAAMARDVIPDGLRNTGATVDVVEAYRTVIPESSIAKARDVFSRCPPDAVTFTSSSTVTNFFALLRAADIERPTGLRVFSIGPVTSGTLREFGWQPSAEADPHTVEGLVESMIRNVQG